MKKKQFVGTGTALITPFKQDDSVDYRALRFLVDWQIRGKIDFLVPVGTTGESPTLNAEEHIKVVASVAEMAVGRVLVLAGTGANSTDEAINLTQAAEKAGADGSLQVAPYYNKPTQEGLFQHFRKIARNTKLPIFLYSIPGRCGVEIGVDTVKCLAAACPNIVGIKEAGGNADRVSQLRAALGPNFVILSGDDSLTLPFMAVGADGVISVASNIIPRAVGQMVRAFAAGRPEEASRLHSRLYSLFKNLFIETNPIPVKTAMAMIWPSVFQEVFRLPLCPMGEENRIKLQRVLKKYRLLEPTAGSLRPQWVLKPTAGSFRDEIL